MFHQHAFGISVEIIIIMMKLRTINIRKSSDNLSNNISSYI